MKCYFKILVIIIIALKCHLLFAQQNNFVNFSVADGLAQSQVYCMVEDHHGYLWMGTQGGGLSRFDGTEFKSFTLQDGLANNYIEALFVDSATLWIGTRNGLTIYDGLKFKSYFPENDQQLAVTSFYQTEEGEMLIGTSKGVYVFDGKSFIKTEELKRLRSAYITGFLKDKNGTLWVTSKIGILRVSPNETQFYNQNQSLNNEEVTSCTKDENGNIWFGTFGGVAVWDGDSFQNIDRSDGLSSDYILKVFTDNKGKIWIGTQDAGISIWNPRDSTFSYLNDTTGLSNNHVRSILQDSWGDIWIGTSGGGICKYFGQQFLHYYISDNPADNFVYAVSQDTFGGLWFSTSDDGVARMDTLGIQYFGKDEGFVNLKSKAIFCDSKGRVWFGTNGNGVAWFDGQHFHFLNKEGVPIGNWTRNFIEDNDGNIWAASASDGIFKITLRDSVISDLRRIEFDTLTIGDSLLIQTDTIIKDTTITLFESTQFSKQNLLPSNKINALYLDNENKLWWASADRGIGYLIDEKKVINFSRTDGLPTNNIKCILGDSLGNIWIGTAGYGIARIKESADSVEVKVFSESDGLISGNVYLMSFDRQGNLWIGCGRGVDQATFDAEQNLKEVNHFGQSEGFYGIETCQNAVFQDAENNLWFGTINGITKYVPGSEKINNIPPILHFTEINLFYESLKNTPFGDWLTTENTLKPGLELPYKQNHLGFEFFGVNLSNPKKVQYQWQLEGLEKEWSPLSFNNKVSYPNLAPGNYTFKVRAFNEDLVGNEQPLSLSFNILPPFWQRWWFIIGAILFGISMITLIFKIRVNQIRSKAKVKQDQLEMENSLLQLEQKALQLQMNPHFIFNALNTVQSLFLSNDPASARLLISKFAKLMRAILLHSRETSIPLKEEVEMLENYLSIEQLSRPNKFEYQIKVAEELDVDELMIPPMMIQPFVENAVKHGINYLKHGGKIEIAFSKKDDKLVCSIIDNGIGRAASTQINAQKAKNHKSTALAVTKERLDILNNENNDNKSLEIKDLINTDGSAAGTEVLVRMPFEEW